MSFSLPIRPSEKEQNLRRADGLRLTAHLRKEANKRARESLRIYETQAASTTPQLLCSFPSRWYAESMCSDGTWVPEWYVRKVCAILRSIEKDEQLEQHTESDKTVVKSTVADRLWKQNWKTSEALLDHCLQRYTDLTDADGQFDSGTVLDAMDDQIQYDPLPDEPENLILPAKPNEDDSEESFVRKYRLNHPIFDWKGHKKHAPRDDELMGDRYAPRNDAEYIAQLKTALGRFGSFKTTNQEELDEFEESEEEEDDVDMVDVSNMLEEQSDEGETSEED